VHQKIHLLDRPEVPGLVPRLLLAYVDVERGDRESEPAVIFEVGQGDDGEGAIEWRLAGGGTSAVDAFVIVFSVLLFM
jgi:hypothetical protein